MDQASSSTALAAAAKPYQQAVLADTPSVFYPLDDASSELKDAGGAGINGVYGGSIAHNGPALVADKTASASFPGGAYAVPDFAQVAPASRLMPAPNVSLELWIQLSKANATGTEIPIVAYGQAADGGIPYTVALTNTDRIDWRIRGSAPWYLWNVAGHTVLSLNQPHHIVGTYNGSTLTLYVDGKLDNTSAGPGPIVYNSGRTGKDGLAIGGELESTKHTFAGNIAELALYARVLSAGQVATHFSAGSLNRAPTLQPTAQPTATPVPNGVTETPHSVNAFVGSVGFNEHLSTQSSVYYTDWPAIRSLTLASGAKHIRATSGNDAVALSRIADLCANGVKHSIDFLITDTPASITKTIDTYGANCVDAVEPANEYDPHGGSPTDPNWVPHILAATKTLYDTIKGNPQFANITVLGPALAGARNYALLGNLESISDAGNLHWSDCDGGPLTTAYKNVVRSLAYLAVSYPTKPIWTTETANMDNPKYGCYLPDSVIAKYMPRTLLVRFNLGEPKTYVYEFADNPPEGSFGYQGLVTAAARPKLQYTAIQSLLTAVGGIDTPHNGVPLTYSITGSTANLQHTLLQGNDGKYHFVLWLEVNSWDTTKHVIITPPPQAIALHLPSSVRSATIATSNVDYTMSVKTVPVVNGALQADVTDSPSVISF